MEKSNLEKALELVPDYETLKDLEDFSSSRIYQKLRIVEKAYEQLAESGVDVSEQLRERRYQIAQLALNTLDATIGGDIDCIIKDRESEVEGAGLHEYKPQIIECATLLDRYLRKLYPKHFTDAESKSVDELFPEP